MKKVTVLGAGMVGSAIAKDLKANFEVTSVDLNENSLERLRQFGIEIKKADLANPEVIRSSITNANLVVGAVPGFMGYNTVKSVIEAGKSIVDISFFPENPLPLNDLALKNNVTVITDCGVAPGLSNLCLGYHAAQMELDSFTCYVGGLPKNPQWPWKYKAPFSPIDVIEEYTRPARLVKNGKVITFDPLTEPELIEFDSCGTLEAFNSDGLRSIINTIKAPNMVEKTLRYQGHREYIEVLKKSGFFDDDMIDKTAEKLFKQWKLGEDEPEFTVMRIIISGKEKGIKKTYTYDLYDEYNPKTKTSSMARTTGYTCTAVVNLLANNTITEKGLILPEILGQNPAYFKSILDYLTERDIKLKLKEN